MAKGVRCAATRADRGHSCRGVGCFVWGIGRCGQTCPSGFTHAVIGGEQKCLHAGEYCSHAKARQYRRYHFVCESVRGTYRLERS